ncbi:MAG TPA: hypothetical protein VFC19_05185 [Candidatus Limnocylindrales bacterium]|nr:hypothetical protein [Candidatus Limnocylindrales bacterium]
MGVGQLRLGSELGLCVSVHLVEDGRHQAGQGVGDWRVLAEELYVLIKCTGRSCSAGQRGPVVTVTVITGPSAVGSLGYFLPFLPFLSFLPLAFFAMMVASFL